MSLTRDEVLAAADLPERVVSTPEWGGHVRIRALSAEEFRLVSSSAKSDDDVFAINLLVASAVDADGKKLFAPKDVEALRKKGWAPISRVFRAALALNGLDEAGLDEAVGNSDGTPENDSGLD